MGCKASVACREYSTKSFNDLYRLHDVIGRGTFAEVVAGTRLADGAAVAVKVTDLRVATDLRSRAAGSAIREADACSAVGVQNHPNVVSLLGALLDECFCYLVLERCQRNLLDYLRSTAMHEEVYGGVFDQMLAGLAHVHGRGVVHRDVKPDNFLVGSDSAIKLCDFGFAARLPIDGGVQGVVGTAPFMSPEMLLDEVSDPATDVWSLGVLAHVILCGEFPYGAGLTDSLDMKKAIRNGKRLKSFQPSVLLRFRGVHLSAHAEDFLRAVLDRSPKKRPSAAAARKLALPRGSFAENTDLPCLSLALDSAVAAGAFDVPSEIPEHSAVLSALQKPSYSRPCQEIRLATPLPTAAPERRCGSATRQPQRRCSNTRRASNGERMQPLNAC